MPNIVSKTVLLTTIRWMLTYAHYPCNLLTWEKINFKKEIDMASNVIVRSVPGKRFTQEVETGKHQLVGDEPEVFGGSDRGPGPYEYLLIALGT